MSDTLSGAKYSHGLHQWTTLLRNSTHTQCTVVRFLCQPVVLN
jgi:hypothetical protein